MKLYRIVISVTVAFSVLAGCDLPESQFYLAEDSSPPVWCKKQASSSANKVSASLTYYIGNNERYAYLKCLPSKGGGDSFKVSLLGMSPVRLGTSQGDRSPEAYEILELNGTREVVRHVDQSNKFRVVDNPQLVEAVGAASTQ